MTWWWSRSCHTRPRRLSLFTIPRLVFSGTADHQKWQIVWKRLRDISHIDMMINSPQGGPSSCWWWCTWRCTSSGTPRSQIIWLKIHFLKLNLTLVKFILKPWRSLYGSLLWIKNKWDVTVRDTKSLPASSPVSLQRWVASFHNKFYKNQFSLELEIFH